MSEIKSLVFHSEYIQKLYDGVRVSKIHKSENGCKLQLKIENVAPCVVSALTRAVIAHVPTIRFDPAFVNKLETNCEPDPYTIPKQIGDVPIQTNPDLFLWDDEILSEDRRKPSWRPRFEADQSITETLGHGIDGRPHYFKISTHFPLDALPVYDERTTLMFHLKVECTFDEETKQLVNEYVTGAHLKWIPIGNQYEYLKQHNAIPIPNPESVIYHLAWGQKMDYMVYAVKGSGFEHSKWSGARSWFNEISKGNYNFFIKSKDNMNPEKYYNDACKVISERFAQLLQDCHKRTTC